MTADERDEETPPEGAAAPEPSPPGGPIVARPAMWHRLKIGAVGLMFLGFGIAFAYDGFYRYPKKNADEEAKFGKSLAKPPYSDLDILLQRALTFVCTPVGVWLLARVASRSRGEYRLDGDVLTISGHPPVPLSAIVRVDKRRWEHKGIAVIDYELADGVTGSFTLDDFYFDRPPTDAIFERIEAYAREAAGDGESAEC